MCFTLIERAYVFPACDQKENEMLMLSIEQIIPSLSNEHDAANFRNIKESNSLHLEDQAPRNHARSRRRGLQADGTDLFGAFSSVTLHYDGHS